MVGQHIERNKNDKEHIVPFRVKEGDIDFSRDDVRIYISKLPIKFNQVPLKIVLDLVVKTNMKLNLVWNHQQLVEDDSELLSPEVHLLRFEGLIATYGNHVSDLVRIRNRLRKARGQFNEGTGDMIKEWVITNID